MRIHEETSKYGYRVCEKLGRGTFADVWKVQDTDLQYFALKEIFIELLCADEQQQLEDEVACMSKLKHPNVIAYVRHFWCETRFCIVMEFAEGSDLSRLIERHKKKCEFIPENRIWKFVRQIAQGLHYMHAKNIIHRDIKPQNILLDQEENIKIADFGLARTMGETRIAKTQCGTPMYMSPEVWRGTAYGIKNDMWGLGCILHELATLEPPFHEKNTWELIERIMKSQPVVHIPSYYLVEVPVMANMLMQKDPARRPSTHRVLDCFFLDDTEFILRRNKSLLRHLNENCIRYNNDTVKNASNVYGVCGYLHV